MAPRCCCCRRAHPCPELGARCAAALLRDFRQIELLWTLLVGAIAISVLAVDNMTAASTLSLSNAGQVSAVSGATLLRIRVALEPMPAALRTTQASLAFIPWPWGLGTWTQLAAPVMAASSSAEITACALAELVPGADRASWEAQMTAMYNRTARVLEFSTTSEPRAVRRRSSSNDPRARARARRQRWQRRRGDPRCLHGAPLRTRAESFLVAKSHARGRGRGRAQPVTYTMTPPAGGQESAPLDVGRDFLENPQLSAAAKAASASGNVTLSAPIGTLSPGS